MRTFPPTDDKTPETKMQSKENIFPTDKYSRYFVHYVENVAKRSRSVGIKGSVGARI